MGDRNDMPCKKTSVIYGGGDLRSLHILTVPPPPPSFLPAVNPRMFWHSSASLTHVAVETGHYSECM